MQSNCSRLLAAALAASLSITSLPSFAQSMFGANAGAAGTAGADAGGMGDSGSGLSSTTRGGMQSGADGGMTPGIPTITNMGSSARNGAEAAEAGGPTRNDRPQAPPRRPLEPSEFQRFVFNSTGQRLTLFGERYFEQSERAFSPVERTPVPADYVLGPGDELYIRAWGSVEVDYRTAVDRNGQISLPRIGTIGVAGLKASEVEGHVRDQIGRVYKNFSLNVTLGQLRSIQVFVVGQARAPGNYTVSSLSTLVNVVFSSGGPNQNGSLRRIQLKRGNQLVTELDLYDFLTNGNKGQDARLLPGDVIVFLPAGPRIALMGAIDTPAIYELKPGGEAVRQVLSYSGGNRASTDLKSVQLERLDPAQPKTPRTVSTLDLSAANDTVLRDGDMLTLRGVAPQFANAVTLRGNVAQPLRYPYTAGMRISQLIPDREALITPDYYIRKNKLVQFMDERRAKAQAELTERLSARTTRSSPTDTLDAEHKVSADELAVDVKNMLDEPNWDYAAIERLNPATLSVEVIPFNLGKAVIDKDPANDLQLRSGDVVTIFGRKDIRSPLAKQTRLVRVEGEVGAPGVYQVSPDDTLPRLLAKAGGLTPQAYVYGIEFSREDTRRKQQQALEEATRRLESELANANATQAANLSSTNDKSAEQLQAAQLAASRAQLAKLRSLKANGRISLELDPTLGAGASTLPNVRLEDGDRVVVPPTPSYVFAVGAVANSNALLWRQGRKLSAYLDVAGVEADADTANIFVVRADGSVIHNSRRGWFSDIEKLELMPGDSVVVPGKTNRETFWTGFVRGLKDWSQILYQFGLTAAAIHTLKQ